MNSFSPKSLQLITSDEKKMLEEENVHTVGQQELKMKTACTKQKAMPTLYLTTHEIPMRRVH